MFVDTSNALGMLDRVEAYTLGGWIVPAAEVVKEHIGESVKIGQDVDGGTFPMWSDEQVYSPRQEARREKEGLTTDIKTMSVTNEMMGSLDLRTIGGIPQLGVAENASDKLNRIMHGQMFHPKWRYHHKILGVTLLMIEKVKAAVIAAL